MLILSISCPYESQMPSADRLRELVPSMPVILVQRILEGPDGLLPGISVEAGIILADDDDGSQGFLVPLILRRLRIDPALAGGVVLTTVTDVIGFMTFLGSKRLRGDGKQIAATHLSYQFAARFDHG